MDMRILQRTMSIREGPKIQSAARKYVLYQQNLVRLRNQSFLVIMSTDVNKSKFIIYKLLQNVGMNKSIARDDAYTLVVKKTLQLSSSSNNSVEIIAEYTDILILLLHHSATCIKPLLLTTLSGSYHITETELYETLSPKTAASFLHSLTGCDTVSSQGWRKMLNSFLNRL